MTELTGCGVFYGSALTEAAACQGQDVYIVGGANSAGQAAMYLARGAKSVTAAGARARRLSASMSHYLIQQIEETPNDLRTHQHGRRGRARLRANWNRSPCATQRPETPNSSTPSGCSSSSARPR